LGGGKVSPKILDLSASADGRRVRDKHEDQKIKRTAAGPLSVRGVIPLVIF